jgi:hypothetical protein
MFPRRVGPGKLYGVLAEADDYVRETRHPTVNRIPGWR